jgi:hypothetical protein
VYLASNEVLEQVRAIVVALAGVQHRNPASTTFVFEAKGEPRPERMPSNALVRKLCQRISVEVSHAGATLVEFGNGSLNPLPQVNLTPSMLFFMTRAYV